MKRIFAIVISCLLFFTCFFNQPIENVFSQDNIVFEQQLVCLSAKSYTDVIPSLKIAQKNGQIEYWNWFPKTGVLHVSGEKEILQKTFQTVSAYIIPNMKITADPIRENATSIKLPPKTWNLEDLDVYNLWDQGYTGKNVKIGILDTGCDGTHPMLKGKIKNFAFIGRDGSADISDIAFDTDNHGTHVSGIAAGGSPENPLGIAPDSSLLVGVVIPGGSGSFSQIIGGIEWALDPDSDSSTDDAPPIINMSLGMPGFTDFWSPIFTKALNQNMLIVCSSGNEGNGVTNSPGNHPYAFGVGSYSEGRIASTFSAGDSDINWNGSLLHVSPYTKPDVSAPGDLIYSSIPGGGYAYFSGTSMASPHVAGAAAILKQVHPSSTAWDLRNALIWGSTDLGKKGWDTRFGNGIINIEQSLHVLDSSKKVTGSITNFTPNTDISLWIPEINSGIYIDKKGQFTAKLIPGEYTVQLKKEKTVLQEETIQIKEKDLHLPFTLPDAALLKMEGVVLDTNGNSLEEAKVAFEDNIVFTDFRGHFSITVPQGEKIIIRKSGYKEVYIVANSTNTWTNIRLKKVAVCLIEGQSSYATVVNPPQQALPYYTSVLSTLGVEHAIIKAKEENFSYSDIQHFDNVILFYANGGMRSSEAQACSTYLEKGGNLAIYGRVTLLLDQYYHEDFFAKYLKIYSKKMVAFPSVKGLYESYKEARFPLSGSGGANNQEICDVIQKMPESGCIPIFKFTPTSDKEFAGVISNNGQYKLAFFSFGLEGIGIKSARIHLVKEVLSWMKQGRKIELHLPQGKKYIQVTRDKELFTIATEEQTYSFNNLFPVAYTFKVEQFGKKPIVFHCDFSTGNHYMANLFFEEGTKHSVSVVPENCSAQIAYLITYYKDNILSTEMVNPQNPINKTLPEGDYLFCLSVKGYNNQFYKLNVDSISEDTIKAVMKMRPLKIHTLLLDDTPSGWGLLDRYLRIGEYSSRWMEATKIPFNYWSVEEKGFPSFHELYPYETIVDIAGRNPYALYTENRQEIIGEYLSNEGRFMILSNNAHTVLDNSDWLSTYFGIAVKNANVREKTIIGVPDTSTEWLYFDIYNTLEQDGFYIPYGEFKGTSDNTKTLLQYASGKVCASFYETDKFRTIYIPFGIDNIMNPDARIDILVKGIKLLQTGDY